MKKLRLESLAVESFETEAVGGVGAMESFPIAPSGDSGCGGCPTALKTCGDTCGKSSCGFSYCGSCTVWEGPGPCCPI